MLNLFKKIVNYSVLVFIGTEFLLIIVFIIMLIMLILACRSKITFTKRLEPIT